MTLAFEDWKADANTVPLMDVAVRYGAQLKRTGQESIGPCPMCGGRDRFSVNPTRGAWNCRGAVGGHDSISLAMHLGNLTFTQACEELTGRKNPSGRDARPLSAAEQEARDNRRREAEATQRARQAQEEAREEDTRDAAFAIWQASGPIPGTIADSYLVQRGFVGVNDPVLRFHPALPYPNGKKYPALIARVDDVAGGFAGIWRTFLRADGRKADVPTAKLGLGPVRGGAVRLGGMAMHIGAAEGLESGLGAWFMIGKRYPVWPCLSTSGLVGFEVPLGVSRLTVFPDGDRPIKRVGNEFVPCVPAGQRAAEALRDRASGEGIDSGIAAYPPHSKDYADIWLASIREVA